MRTKILAILASAALTLTAGSALADEPLATLNGLAVQPMTAAELAETVGEYDFLTNYKADTRSPIYPEWLQVAEAADGNNMGKGLDRAENKNHLDWSQD